MLTFYRQFTYYTNINPFVPIALFLNPLKKSEKQVLCFQGVEKGCIRNEWDKRYINQREYESFNVNLSRANKCSK